MLGLGDWYGRKKAFAAATHIMNFVVDKSKIHGINEWLKKLISIGDEAVIIIMKNITFIIVSVYFCLVICKYTVLVYTRMVHWSFRSLDIHAWEGILRIEGEHKNTWQMWTKIKVYVAPFLGQIYQLKPTCWTFYPQRNDSWISPLAISFYNVNTTSPLINTAYTFLTYPLPLFFNQC